MKYIDIIVLICLQYSAVNGKQIKDNEPKQTWNYVTVRPDAHMFWWLYYTTASEGYMDKPLVMWLQGGPGGSSTGFGNFGEIGPLDVNLNNRDTTWVSEASVLFVDNPVGTGYSYVDNDNAYTTDVTQIAKDLLTMFKSFLKEVPDFKTVPFYIFSESYGGKMTAAFSQALNNAIKDGSVSCNFKGFAMGDSWISGIDSVISWGPYLYGTSLITDSGLDELKSAAQKCKNAFDSGNYKQSTEIWDQMEGMINGLTGGVDMYNIMVWDKDPGQDQDTLYWSAQDRYQQAVRNLYKKHIGRLHGDPLSDLMNGLIRQKLGIIPKNVTWGGQSGEVFTKQNVDFMKPVVDIVDDLIQHSNLSVVVYSGQLDLIVDTIGTEMWLNKLTWPELKTGYYKATRKPIRDEKTNDVVAYQKTYKNFSFFWILNAGHMVPSDNGKAALKMLRTVIDG